jgi:hypothetical protein
MVINAHSLNESHGFYKYSAAVQSCKPDLIFVTETWFTSRYADVFFYLAIVALEETESSVEAVVCVLVCILKCHLCTEIDIAERHDLVENLWVRVTSFDVSYCVRVCYHPFNQFIMLALSLNCCIIICNHLLSNTDQFPKDIIILADNFNRFSYVVSRAKFGLSQTITTPTRLHYILDVFVTITDTICLNVLLARLS